MKHSPNAARLSFGPVWQRLKTLSLRVKITALAMLLLAAALFEPRWSTTRDAYDFVVTLDVTQSMNVLDYELDGKPASRLDYAKHMLRETLPELPCGSRVGWAIFTEYRVLLLVAPIEVCDNYQELIASLERIDGRMAWANASEVAKGLFWALRMVKELGGGHGIVFITDGHESPPLNPRHRPVYEGKAGDSGKPYAYLDQTTWQYKPVYDGRPGEVRGMIVGIGGDALRPIPKTDPEGHSLGFWQANEVMQTDVFSAGRTGSEAGERLVDENGKSEEAARPTMSEHLSSLKNAYLQNLARETDLGYHRLTDTPALLRAFTSPDLAHPGPYRADLRVLLACIAFVLLVAANLPALGSLLPKRLTNRMFNSRT